jgi:hypothetical protein
MDPAGVSGVQADCRRPFRVPPERAHRAIEVIPDESGRPVPGPVADVQVHVVDEDLAEPHRHNQGRVRFVSGGPAHRPLPGLGRHSARRGEKPIP